MTVLRRFLLLWIFFFWQAGFFFYGSVVVAIGTVVLGSAKEQGVLSRSVAIGVNLAGAVALAAWLWDLLAERGPFLRRRWGAWAFLVATLATLAILHPLMDAQFDTENREFHHFRTFRALHRAYLWTHTFQWLGSLLLTWWTLRAWRANDLGCGRQADTEKGRQGDKGRE